MFPSCKHAIPIRAKALEMAVWILFIRGQLLWPQFQRGEPFAVTVLMSKLRFNRREAMKKKIKNILIYG